MTFNGFPKEALEFLEDLEQNNDREWFKEHKDTYERACRAPMAALLEELAAEFGDTKVFRIHRDVRFSADKSPYKTNIAGTVGSGYVSLSPEAGLYVGAGSYMMDAADLKRYRDAVVADGSGGQLDALARKLTKKGHDFGAHDELKTAPRGYAKEHPRLRFLRFKGLHTGKTLGDGPWLQTRKALDKVRTVLRDSSALTDWLAANVHR